MSISNCLKFIESIISRCYMVIDFLISHIIKYCQCKIIFDLFFTR